MVAMGRCGVTELVLEKEGVKLQLKREEKTPVRGLESMMEALEENPMRVDFEKHRSNGVMAAAQNEMLVAQAEKAAQDEIAVFVTSPMVGTFYHSPSPNDPPFVKVGDRVEKNTVVCIIEAMKVMNEVKAGVSGTVAEVLVENNHPVEFGTKLLRIIPT